MPGTFSKVEKGALKNEAAHGEGLCCDWRTLVVDGELLSGRGDEYAGDAAEDDEDCAFGALPLAMKEIADDCRGSEARAEISLIILVGF